MTIRVVNSVEVFHQLSLHFTYLVPLHGPTPGQPLRQSMSYLNAQLGLLSEEPHKEHRGAPLTNET